MKNNEKKNQLIVIQKESIFKKIINFVNRIFKFNKKNNVILEEKNIKNNIQLTIEKKDEFKVELKEEIKKEDMQTRNDSQILNDTEYYKKIYNSMNNGELSITDLTPDEFLKVMQMQKIEYELITEKLKNSMDDLKN